MTTEHFNGLTEAEQERLVIIAEECGEVVQSTCKILRHGYESKNAQGPRFRDEPTGAGALGDVLHAIKRMTMAGDLTRERLEERADSKPSRILPYLHHQPECSTDAPARCCSCLKHIAVCECPF